MRVPLFFFFLFGIKDVGPKVDMAGLAFTILGSPPEYFGFIQVNG